MDELQTTDSVDALARDVSRLESLRSVKDLQRTYAHLQQYGLWDEMASLFAADATFIAGDTQVVGRDAIRTWLTEQGGGRPGLSAGALNTELIDEPLANLSADGRSAKCRWMTLALRGDGAGRAWFEGGILENEYVLDDTWKIAVHRYYPNFEGEYERGWANVDDEELPLFPFHFTLEETGTPLPPPTGTAPPSGTTLGELASRIAALNDEDAVRNLQHAYGYYVDRRMWDDVVDLFSEECAVDLDGRVLRGKEGVRTALETMGRAGLAHGILNERLEFDTMVSVAPGGVATSRTLELGLLADADEEKGGWELRILRDRFVKESGLWKLAELRIYTVMTADYATGWGKAALPGRALPPLPAFLGRHPTTGVPVDTLGYEVVANEPLTDHRAVATAVPVNDLSDLRRRYRRSAAFDGSENVSAAYGYYLDDFQWSHLSGIMATKGNKQSPFAGYYLGRERIQGAADAMWGPPPERRASISYHWRTQHVIHVSHDGRSANLRTRLFQPRTSKDASGTPSTFYMGGLHGGMYPNDQTVLEDGVWRLWSVTIDEHYFHTPTWADGWAGAKDPEVGPASRPSPLLEKYPPDIRLTDLGRREEGFRGGTGTTITWPGILPMWFHYRNPVSGRTPERFWPDCVPSEMLPDSSMTRHGYEMPPNGPEIDGTELE